MHIYCVITAEIFHYGHARFLQNARGLGDSLTVGVCSDVAVAQYKRNPIMTLAQRCAVIAACRYVDALIPAAPPFVPLNWLDHLNIDLVAAGGGYSEQVLNPYYHWPKQMGILRIMPYTEDISSTEIIEKCKSIDQPPNKTKDNLKTQTNDHQSASDSINYQILPIQKLV